MRILAVGAHLDDIEVACGGTLAKAIRRGHEVRMLVLSASAYTNYHGEALRTRSVALLEGRQAATVLGVDDLVVLDHDTKDIPHHSKVVESIEAELDQFGPDLILTHHAFDTHQAHVGTSLSTISAARRQPGILMYEATPPSGRSYVPFRPQVYIDVSETINQKIESLKAHTSQYHKYGDRWLEALEARARFRGYEAGVLHAEAFEVLRMPLAL